MGLMAGRFLVDDSVGIGQIETFRLSKLDRFDQNKKSFCGHYLRCRTDNSSPPATIHLEHSSILGVEVIAPYLLDVRQLIYRYISLFIYIFIYSSVQGQLCGGYADDHSQPRVRLGLSFCSGVFCSEERTVVVLGDTRLRDPICECH